jgi:hypothetical protein
MIMKLDLIGVVIFLFAMLIAFNLIPGILGTIGTVIFGLALGMLLQPLFVAGFKRCISFVRTL